MSKDLSSQSAGNAESQLSERAQILFKALVEKYITDGSPVGSRTLSKDCNLNLSPATVRNVLSDLEEHGLLSSPHTSSGRIPTSLGYRFFVDSLLTFAPLSDAKVERLKYEMSSVTNKNMLVQSASEMLSELTQLAAIVSIPKQNKAQLRHIEFLPLSANQVLVIMVMNNSEVQNRIIDTAQTYTQSQLQMASNYLNASFAGRDLQEIRDNLIGELESARKEVNDMMQMAIEMAQAAFKPENTEGDVMVSGQTHLMDYVELAHVEKLRALFDAFNDKRDILHLIDSALRSKGVQIFIGEESGYSLFEDMSLVTAPYEVDGNILGVLGVVGPTRIAYDRIVPAVDITARVLGAALHNNI